MHVTAALQHQDIRWKDDQLNMVQLFLTMVTMNNWTASKLVSFVMTSLSWQALFVGGRGFPLPAHKQSLSRQASSKHTYKKLWQCSKRTCTKLWWSNWSKESYRGFQQNTGAISGVWRECVTHHTHKYRLSRHWYHGEWLEIQWNKFIYSSHSYFIAWHYC